MAIAREVGMTEDEKAQLKLLQQAVDSFADEHRGLADQWDAIDRKALGMVTVAGIFIAGILAFVRALSTGAHCAVKVALSFTMLCLTFSVLAALLALLLRSAVESPHGSKLKEMVDDLIAKTGAAEFTRSADFARDHASLWKAANESVRTGNISKAHWLETSQVLLVIGIVAASAATVLEMWGH